MKRKIGNNIYGGDLEEKVIYKKNERKYIKTKLLFA